MACKTISTQVVHHGSEKVQGVVFAYLNKAALSLGIDLPVEAAKVITEDILTRYPYESIEDVMECLRKGRSGVYNFGHNHRNKINMQLIGEWMDQHLTEKAKAREEKHHNQKNQDSGITEGMGKVFKEIGNVLSDKKEKGKIDLEEIRNKAKEQRAGMYRALVQHKSDKELQELLSMYLNNEGDKEIIKAIEEEIEFRKKI